MNNSHNKAVAETYGAIDVLDSDSAPLIDLKAVARNFVEQRLQNSKTTEDIRKIALDKLRDQLNSEDCKVSVGGLLNIVDTLNNSSKEDMNVIIRSQGGGIKNNSQNTNYYNLFLNNDGNDNSNATSAPATLTTKQFGIIEHLVIAAESITAVKNEE